MASQGSGGLSAALPYRRRVGRPGRAVIALAQYALDENQLRRLADTIGALRDRAARLRRSRPFKLAVLGNATLEPVVPALVASAARYGIALECVEADFGQTVQEALSPGSRVNLARPDAVLLALDHRGVALGAPPGDSDAAAASVADAVEFVRTVRAALRANGGARSIVQTLAPPAETVFGSFDRAVPGTPRNLAAAFNAALIESLGEYRRRALRRGGARRNGRARQLAFAQAVERGEALV